MREGDIKDMIEKTINLEKLLDARLNDWRYVLEGANSIWSLAQFKVGQLVRLNKTPEITREKSWGWFGSKHYLIKGALAVVKERQFYDGTFVYGLHFQDESWVDGNGICQPVSGKALYSFGERWLESAEYEQLTCEAL
jgi:hypothetical protein